MRTGPTAPLARKHRRPRSFLRTTRLNAVGYAALAGGCLVAGFVSGLALAPTGWPLLLRVVVGPVVVLVALVVADRPCVGPFAPRVGTRREGRPP